MFSFMNYLAPREDRQEEIMDIKWNCSLTINIILSQIPRNLQFIWKRNWYKMRNHEWHMTILYEKGKDEEILFENEIASSDFQWNLWLWFSQQTNSASNYYCNKHIMFFELSISWKDLIKFCLIYKQFSMLWRQKTWPKLIAK